MLFVRILCVCVGGCLDGWVSRGDEVGGGPAAFVALFQVSKAHAKRWRRLDLLDVRAKKAWSLPVWSSGSGQCVLWGGVGG